MKTKNRIKYALDVDIIYKGTWKPGSLLDENGRSFFPIGHFKTTNHSTNIGWILEMPDELFNDFSSLKCIKMIFRTDMGGIYDPHKDTQEPVLTLHVRPGQERHSFRYKKSDFEDDLVTICVSTRGGTKQKQFVDAKDFYEQKEFWVFVSGGSHIYIHPQISFIGRKR